MNNNNQNQVTYTLTLGYNKETNTTRELVYFSNYFELKKGYFRALKQQELFKNDSKFIEAVEKRKNNPFLYPGILTTNLLTKKRTFCPLVFGKPKNPDKEIVNLADKYDHLYLDVERSVDLEKSDEFLKVNENKELAKEFEEFSKIYEFQLVYHKDYLVLQTLYLKLYIDDQKVTNDLEFKADKEELETLYFRKPMSLCINRITGQIFVFPITHDITKKSQGPQPPYPNVYYQKTIYDVTDKKSEFIPVENSIELQIEFEEFLKRTED